MSEPRTLTLYDHPRSSNALKVRFLLAELDLPYERREVPMAQPRPADYLEVNPVGLIPTLVDGDVVVSESNAILRYLARREGRRNLYPTVAAGAAAVDEWLDRFSMTLRPALFRVEQAALGYVPGKGFLAADADPELAQRRIGEIGPTLTLFDRLVSPKGYALGKFSIVDCAAAPALRRTRDTGLDLAPYPNLERWRETVCARPAFAAADPVL